MGLLWQLTERTRVELTYESEISHHLEGKADYSSSDPVARRIINSPPFAAVFADGGSSAELDTES